MANELAIEILYEQYGEENVEILEGNMARTPDGIVTLIAKTNPRHEIAAELYAIGMRGNEIEKILKRDKDKPSSGYYSRILKNPLVVKHRESFAKEVSERAKAKLTQVVVRAAENVADLVNNGDYASSIQVLKAADVINPVHKSEVHKKITFGDWLIEEREKAIPIDPVKAGKREYIEEATLVDKSTGKDMCCLPDEQPVRDCGDATDNNQTGEQLDYELFSGDKNG